MNESKLLIVPGWFEDGNEEFQGVELDWVGISRETGLDPKTLRALHKGGFHKIETAFQFEMLGRKLPGMEKKEPNPGPGGYRRDLYLDDEHNDKVFEAITDNKMQTGEIVFACALPSSAIVREIEKAARFTQKSRISNDSKPGLEKKELDRMFNNFLSTVEIFDKKRDRSKNQRIIHNGGFAADFRFTIQNVLLPLTRVQITAVKQLNADINTRVESVRKETEFSDSLEVELQKQTAEDANRRSLLKTLAKLKRLKVNTLLFREERIIKLVDEDYGEERVLPEFFQEVLHVVLSPAETLRVPFSLMTEEWETREPEYQDENFDELYKLEGAPGTEPGKLIFLDKRRSRKDSLSETDE